MNDAIEEKEKRSAIAEELAVLTQDGVGINKCVEQLAQKYDLSITRAKLARLKTHPKYLETLSSIRDKKREIVEAEIEAGKLTIQSIVAKDAALYAECLRQMAQDGKPQAVVTAIQILGMGEDDGQKQATQMTVILPGAKAPKEIDITKKKREDEE